MEKLKKHSFDTKQPKNTPEIPKKNKISKEFAFIGALHPALSYSL